jgi:PKHD-type hydroxylase|tara:strand:- start:1895 stop:2524 length:630 start_codon:yes stop_codon:yes gene_type:complete
MQLNNYYYYFKSAIPNRICDDIVKYGKQLQEQTAVTGEFSDKTLNQKQIKDLKKTRNSNIVWMNDRWIYKEIQPYIHQANKNAGWNFQWDWSESCQFTKYKKGQFYDWHRDGWNEAYIRNNKNDPSNGKIRKLSVTVSLSDPKEYKGGELEFDYKNSNPNQKNKLIKCTEILPKGSLVVFPSFVWHRVCPVKSGERYSLVVWNLGWPFK